MRNKDQILLESIYERILLKENSDEEYLRLAQDTYTNKKQLQMMVYDAAKAVGVKKKQMVKTLISSLSHDELNELDAKIKNVVEYYAESYWDSVGDDKASYDNDRNNYLQIQYNQFYTAGGDAYEIVTTGDFIGHKDLQIFEIHNDQRTQLAVDLSSLDGRFPSDPVTYDDKGNIIPLSQRFNSSNNDIRY